MRRKSHYRKKPKAVIGVDLAKGKDRMGYINVCEICGNKRRCPERRGIQCTNFKRS